MLKYSDRPVLQYNGSQGSRFQSRLPAGVQPIATAPITSQPIVVWEPDGKGRWALHHSGAWREIKPFKDSRDGRVSWRMDGSLINNPVAWSLPQRKR